MTLHLDAHERTETITTAVYDLMSKNGQTQVYGGRIYEGVRSYGYGVANATKM